MPLDEEPDDDVAKIARYAAQRGFWSERSAKDMAAQARLHATSPRSFLKKMLEIKGGLTHDEIARLEKEALAPPAPPPPSRPLPRPFDGAEPAGAPEIASTTEGKALPRPFEGAPAAGSQPAPAAEIQPMATPSRALPRMMAKPPSGTNPALPGTTPPEGTVLKKKLPSMGGKKPASTPSADALGEPKEPPRSEGEALKSEGEPPAG